MINFLAWMVAALVFALPWIVVEALQEMGFDATLTLYGYILMLLIVLLCTVSIQTAFSAVLSERMKEFTMQILKAQARSAGTPRRVH